METVCYCISVQGVPRSSAYDCWGMEDFFFVWISDAEWKIKHLHAVLIVTLPPGDNEQLLQLSFSSVQM